jgi:hypothetical protein
MWHRFQEHSYKFEGFAYRTVEEKLRAAGPKFSLLLI